MVRIALMVLASLGLGAGGMWLASNFKLRLEAVGGATTEKNFREAEYRATDPDLEIRPAAAIAPQTLPLAIVPLAIGAADPTPEIQPRIAEAVGGVPVNWTISSNDPVRISSSSITLKVKNLPAKERLILILDGVDKKPTAEITIAGDNLAIPVASLFDGKSQVKLQIKSVPPGPDAPAAIGAPAVVPEPSKPSNAIVLVKNETKPDAPQIRVTGFARSKYLNEFAPAGGFDPTTRLKIANGYLRIHGDTTVSDNLKFFLVESDGTAVPLAGSAVKQLRAPVGEWEYELQLDRRESLSRASILIRGFSGERHFDAVRLVPVEWVSKSAPAAPEFGDVLDVPESGTVLQKAPVSPLAGGKNFRLPGTRVFRANVKEGFSVAVKKPTDADALLLFVGNQETPTVVDLSKESAAHATFVGVALPGEGEHVIAVAAATGGDPPGPRVRLTVLVHSAGPRAERVVAPTFGTGDQRRETIKVQFSGVDIDKDSAGKVANYALKHNEGTDKTIADAKYDETSKTVSLSVTEIVPGTYTLTVKAAIRDLFGNTLVRQDGTANDQTFDLSTGTAAAPTLPSTVPSAFSMTTGPNIEFKEFEPRKVFLNGFNPADRVETRVVRLYYNRDAARVVQVVNRDAKSWNAQGVEVRRRVADRSRDEANASTDERKKQESLAVQAATEARAAENRLRELQSKLTQARTQAATATAQIGQRQQELATVQRAQGRERTDTFDDPAQARVLQLEADIARLKIARDAGTSATEETVLEAQKALAEKQRKQAATIGEVRTELDKRDDIKASNAKIAVIQGKLANPATPATEFPQLQADLDAANQNHSQVVANALVQTPALATKLDDAAIDVQKQQLEVDRKQASFAAGKELTTKESALVEAKRNLTRAQVQAGDAALGSASAVQNELRGLQAVVSAANAKEESLRSDITSAMNDVQAKRIKEVELTLKARELDQKELRARENQFRSEVAAAKEDADIYAPGKPDSFDPVRQCSLSVIGEGLIQIRGPIKGVNIIRTMINQIDAPTGQVRVGVHTVQVNGERVDRMNKVVANIQRYLDHSRFLTAQSSQMLRKAVTAVAARKAEECNASLLPGCSQADRDAKYLTCFFGKDFLDELRQLDSEFLRTGNKLLSLHSMDSTSLSAALTLLALAKNDIRAEILQEFATQTQSKLPEAEQNFYLAGLACPTKCEACFDKKFCMLAQNAKFESFRGFFNLEIQGADTLTPVQREFVRLAQIFKTRLVTELELRQRVIERSLLEDRMGDYEKELREAKERDDEARKALIAVQDKMQTAIAEATIAFADTKSIMDEIDADLADQDRLLDGLTTDKKVIRWKSGNRSLPVANKEEKNVRLTNKGGNGENYDWIISAMKSSKDYIRQFYFISKENYDLFDKAVKKIDDIVALYDEKMPIPVERFQDLRETILKVMDVVRANASGARRSIDAILAGLGKQRPDLVAAITNYNSFRTEILEKLRDGERIKIRVKALFTDKLDTPFRNLQEATVLYQAAQRRAQLARRSLDEKKLLDMLIDEMEDKYIELLDGTRAHTANVDNYLKALSTALDDDFNTQFYNPAFAKIRTLGAGWDVQLGQIESTSVLTNNRVFAKVSPAASMEFDLPKRDIFIREAFKGAKAAVDEYGALLSDPTFLTLAKMYGGAPTAATFGAGGSPAVRGVLPGQASSADEMLMAQAGSNRKEFGAALEALIPDPAIYKFETGTGYEIRPVMSPDGQAVVFGFDYLYTTDVREPVRADEKHLGRVKRHFVHTDVQLSNFEMREVSKYWVSLKAARTGRGVALLQDVPGVGVLFRPLPSASSSLQQNLIYSQATLFPTLFDLMGLRYAPAIADIDPEFTKNDEFVVRGRRDYLRMFIFDYGASRVDDALRILTGERRPDLYRSQHTIPWEHPNGYRGPGMRQRDAILEEGYDPREAYPKSPYVPGMVLPNRSPIPGGPGFVPESYELPPTMGGETKRGPAGLTPPAGMGFTPPGGEYTARPIGTTITPQYGPASIRAPGASRLSPSIPPPGTPLPFPNELPK